MSKYENTINWDVYWESDDLGPFPADVGSSISPVMERFFARHAVPETFASFGCGPADCSFALAEEYPETAFYATDAAPTIIEDNRREADEKGLENLKFAVETLPDISTERTFDFVFCYATLHYVKDIERAIQNLYDRVRSGGYLVFNYPPTERPEENTERPSKSEEIDESFKERFQLVFRGENLLSEADIERLLGTQLHDFWEVTDATHEHGAKPGNPCVFVRKE